MATINPTPPIPIVPLTPDLEQPLAAGPGEPLVMLPVRLETRFFPTSGGGADLCVRVYPDKIHIDTHEPKLTDQEIVWGKHFWEQTWRAGNDEEARKIAWRQLVERFDSGRAAWVARALRPLNPVDRPAQPMPGEQPLPKPINFPAPATKSNAWTRAPVTNVLPQRWWVFGYAGGKLILKGAGNPIPDELATGPDPFDNSAEPAEGELGIDKGMKWMVDFAEAVRVGMGIRLRLTSDQAAGFDFLLVFGIRAASDSTSATQALVKLLEAHHYTDGLSFVLQGTPSNNTPDAPSGFSSSDPGQEESYTSERGQTAFQAGDGSNADVLATALGLRDANILTLAHIGNANAQEQLDARHMNRALWPATWGYCLTQMIGAPLTPDDCAWARQHFIDHVRAAGPLPTLRVGKQPYGILPTMSLEAWKPKLGEEQQHSRDMAVRNFLVSLRRIWSANLSQAPRLGRTENNPDQDFKDIFSMDGISSRYSVRHVMGETYLRALWSAMIPGDQTLWWVKQQELARAGLNLVGLNWNPRLAHATYSGWFAKLNGPITQPEMLAENAPLAPNYIDLLLKESDLERLHTETFDSGQPKGLLYSVLRHAMLTEYWMAAAKLSGTQLTTAAGPFISREEEIVVPGSVTAWDLLRKPLPGAGNDSAWSFLSALLSSPADPAIALRVATLLEFRESLAHLNTVSAAKLQRLFAGTLDLCSHRLDAWITSFATRRLTEMRKAKPTGVLIGGYGWVMNLKPAPPPAQAVPPTGEQGVFFLPANNPGYTHTPSLAQAETVAVLRSGHLTHADANTKDLLAIDLASDRVRLAEWLLDGVRQGQPLGALLGYRFERRLQETGLGQFIPAFRQVAPLVAKKLQQTADQTVNQSVESIAANNVVDGLALQRQWKRLSSISSLFSQFGPQPPMTPMQTIALQVELNSLDEAVDAVSDALLAETVHHAVQGSPLSTASTLEAIASGEAPPPELEVVRTPRTGVAITHRLVALFSSVPKVPVDSASPAVSHRANAEPILNAWVAKLLGSPSRVRCVVERIDPATNAVLEIREMRLDELELAPLDFVYSAAGSRDAQPSEIEQRILYAIRRRLDRFAADGVLRINPGRGSGWSTSDLSYGEFNELLSTARKLITGAREIDGSELNLPDKNQSAGVNVVELQARADNAAQALRQTHEDLRALLSGGTVSHESQRELILRSGHFGIAGAVPFSATGDSPADRDTLLQQGSSIAKELGDRVGRLTTLETTFNSSTASEEDQCDHHIARLRVTFGSSFVVLPQFKAGNAAELEKALADSAQIQDEDALAVVRCFQQASRVRKGVARLDDSLRYAEVLQTGARLDLRIAQLPYQEEDRWVGLSMKPGAAISSSRFSLIMQVADTLDVSQPLAGLFIDEWIEVVPNASETTGMVFQYDQPNGAPPQCILLAVPPDLDQSWNLWSVQQTLLETLDLARLRVVDPELLDGVGHYLPALYFAVNSARDTISTDFSKLK